MTEGRVEPIYAGANGSYYTNWQVRRRLEEGTWSACLRDDRSGNRLVETETSELLMLVPTGRDALPTWAEIRVDDASARVVDTRRQLR